MDYIYFVYGLTFMLLAGLCAAMRAEAEAWGLGFPYAAGGRGSHGRGERRPARSGRALSRRDAEGQWQSVEGYIEKRSDAQFTHGICPDCSKKFYSDL